MIHALFFDLDGTLLNSEKKLTGRTLSALNACRERGIRLFVATARPPILGRMLGWTEEEQELFDGGVYCNGGCEVIEERMRYYFIPQQIVEACISRVNICKTVNIALQMAGSFMRLIIRWRTLPIRVGESPGRRQCRSQRAAPYKRSKFWSTTRILSILSPRSHPRLSKNCATVAAIRRSSI